MARAACSSRSIVKQRASVVFDSSKMPTAAYRAPVMARAIWRSSRSSTSRWGAEAILVAASTSAWRASALVFRPASAWLARSDSCLARSHSRWSCFTSQSNKAVMGTTISVVTSMRFCRNDRIGARMLSRSTRIRIPQRSAVPACGIWTWVYAVMTGA